MSTTLAVGDTAPLFELRDQHNQTVRLSDFLVKGPVVIFFYPKDNTPGCTAEVCAFRDSYAVFQDLGVQVVGISADSHASHADFAQQHNLPFCLLVDENDTVRKAYGVKKTLGILPGRETFVIDAQGILRHRFSSQLQPEKHIDEALIVLKTLLTP